MLSPAKEAEIPGIYTEEFSFATDTFTIAPNHTFTQQVFITATKKTHEIKGTWSMDEYGIILEKAFVVRGMAYGTGEKRLSKWFGKPQVRHHGVYKIRFTKKTCFGAGDDLGPCKKG